MTRTLQSVTWTFLFLGPATRLSLYAQPPVLSTAPPRPPVTIASRSRLLPRLRDLPPVMAEDHLLDQLADVDAQAAELGAHRRTFGGRRQHGGDFARQFQGIWQGRVEVQAN